MNNNNNISQQTTPASFEEFPRISPGRAFLQYFSYSSPESPVLSPGFSEEKYCALGISPASRKRGSGESSKFQMKNGEIIMLLYVPFWRNSDNLKTQYFIGF